MNNADSEKSTTAVPAPAIKHFSEAWAGLLIFVILTLAAFVAYRRVMNNTLIGDDYILIEFAGKQPVLQLWKLFSGLAPQFMRPVPLLLWWLQYKIFGTAGLPSHVINTGLHAGSAFMLYYLLFKLGASRLAALLTAFLFVLTPVGPEAVAWSAGRFDILALSFMLLALCLYAAYLKNPARPLYAGAIVATAAALLSKEQAIMLVIVLPAMDILYANFPRNETRGMRIDWPKALKQSVRRLVPFFAVFAIFVVLRYLALGGFGGYVGVPKYGIPKWFAIKTTFNTLLSPLNNLMFAEVTMTSLLDYMYLLVVVSIVAVVFCWRSTSSSVRRLWLFLLVIFLTSLIPIFPDALMGGLSSSLKGSRFLYTPTAAILSLIVVSMVEFGWKNRILRIAPVLAIVLLLPVYLWAINNNNKPWEDSAAISYYIPEAAYSLLPEPPLDSRLYFENVPARNESGAYVFINGLPQAIRFKYDRDDLEIIRPGVDPMPEGANLSDGYLFYYDMTSQQLKLVSGPMTPGGENGPV